MLNENEIIMLVLGVGVLALLSVYRSKIKRIHFIASMRLAFYLLVACWTFTLLEDLFLYDLMNVLQHICFASSAVFTAYGCWRFVANVKKEAGQ